jgi:hypothetical protein
LFELQAAVHKLNPVLLLNSLSILNFRRSCASVFLLAIINYSLYEEENKEREEEFKFSHLIAIEKVTHIEFDVSRCGREKVRGERGSESSNVRADGTQIRSLMAVCVLRMCRSFLFMR